MSQFHTQVNIIDTQANTIDFLKINSDKMLRYDFFSNFFSKKGISEDLYDM